MLTNMLLIGAVSALAALAPANAYFILGHKILETTRLDPIISPGAVSGHVHTIAGGSNFDKTMNYNTTALSTCTTASVTLDKSNYWTPQLYFWNQTTDAFTMIPVAFMNTYYLPRPSFTGENITAFPKGLRMLQGNPTLRTFDSKSTDQLAVSYVCLDGTGASHQGDASWNQRNSFFEHNCPSGMRAQVNFRSCWDGVNLDSSDHASHMAWPSGGVDGGTCPSSHPVKLPMLFYEVIYQVQNFPYVNGSWVFAQGDPTGYGMHGDFVMGWQDAPDGTNVLQAAVNGCNANNGVGGELQNCPPFVPYLNSGAASSCQPMNPIVNEAIGSGNTWISSLPGNNPVTNANGPVNPVVVSTNATSTAPTPPGFTPTQETINSNYTLIGCVAEGPSGRALTAATYINTTSMTLGMCVNYCNSKGYAYAGIEYGSQCYCDGALKNGATGAVLDNTNCGMACPGNQYANCGGSATLTLYKSSVAAAATTLKTSTLPAGWNQTGCIAEAKSGRALTGASWATSTGMSQGACVSFCAGKGFPYAGIEYGQECYCGYSLMNSASTTLLPITSCGMSCSNTSFVETCGGSSTLLLFNNPALNPTADVLPSGWTSDGCRADSGSVRTLSAYTYSASNMTQLDCVNRCASKGYSIAGLEYGTQCYCANAYSSGQGTLAASTSSCAMQCGGKATTICGGPSLLTTFKYVNATSAALVSPTSCTATTTVTQTVYVTQTVSPKRRAAK